MQFFKERSVLNDYHSSDCPDFPPPFTTGPWNIKRRSRHSVRFQTHRLCPYSVAEVQFLLETTISYPHPYSDSFLCWFISSKNPKWSWGSLIFQLIRTMTIFPYESIPPLGH